MEQAIAGGLLFLVGLHVVGRGLINKYFERKEQEHNRNKTQLQQLLMSKEN